MENSIEMSASHAEKCSFQAASDESLLQNGLLHANRVTASSRRAMTSPAPELRTTRRKHTGRTASPGPGRRRPAAPAPAPRCLHHACLYATPSCAACAAFASWIASPTHTTEHPTCLGPRPLSAAPLPATPPCRPTHRALYSFAPCGWICSYASPRCATLVRR